MLVCVSCVRMATWVRRAGWRTDNGQPRVTGPTAHRVVRERGGVVPRMALGRETRDCTVCTPRENKGAFNLEFVCVLGHGVTAVLYLCAGRARDAFAVCVKTFVKRKRRGAGGRRGC